MVKTSTLVATVTSILAVTCALFFYKEHKINIQLKQQIVKQTATENVREIKVLISRSKSAKIQLISDQAKAKAKLAVRNEQLCLAKNVFYEASNETTEGKIAVAQVTVQRAKHPSYPDHICDVVYQKIKSQCQFSWHCDANIQRIKPTQGPLWEESKKIAKQVLVDGVRLPEIHGALFFKANYVPETGFWSTLTPVSQIGVHVFYKR